MNRKSVLKFHVISAFFEGEIKLIERGENAYESNHVQNCIYDKEFRFIRGKVHASMKDKVYTIEVDITGTGAIKSASCNCPRGQLRCDHIAALLLYYHHNISVTDQSCSWSKRTKRCDEQVQTITELFPVDDMKYKNYVATSAVVTEEKKQFLYSRLNKTFGTTVGMTWLLAPEPAVSTITQLGDIIFSSEFDAAVDKKEFILKHSCLTREDILKINEETLGQAQNPTWFIQRQHRLTASNFGKILKAYAREKFSPSLFKTLIGSYSLEGIKSINWGIENEDHAIKCFEDATGFSVTRCGLYVHESGLLAASPDGIVDQEDSLIEIKCPFKFRNCVLQELLKTNSEYFIIYDNEKDCFTYNKNHNYYDQIQGQLYLTGKKMCNFFAWAPAGGIVIEIYKDDDWSVNIQKLLNFYFKHYIPYLWKTCKS